MSALGEGAGSAAECGVVMEGEGVGRVSERADARVDWRGATGRRFPGSGRPSRIRSWSDSRSCA